MNHQMDQVGFILDSFIANISPSVLESPTQIIDDNFDEPFRMRSYESTIKHLPTLITLLSLSASSRRELYNLGITDILTNYGMKKKECSCSKNEIIRFRCRRHFHCSTGNLRSTFSRIHRQTFSLTISSLQ